METSVHRNVLVVEDDPDCGQLVVMIVGKAGYGVRLVTSRDDAVTALNCNIYDFMLMDVRMPGMPLDEFAKFLSGKTRTPKIVIMTAEKDAASVAKKYNISNWIKKPFFPDRLLELLREPSSNPV